MVMSRKIATTRAISSALTACLAASTVVALLASPASAASHAAQIAAIDQIARQGLRREVFALDSPTEVRIRAEGLADRQGTHFLAYGWILDLASRRPAWVMDATNGAWDSKTQNWKVDDRVTLPAGTYALYYASYGGSFPLDKEIRVLGLILGRFESSVGPNVKWNEYGDDSRWGIRVDGLSAGIDGDRDGEHLSHKYVCIGWVETNRCQSRPVGLICT